MKYGPLLDLLIIFVNRDKSKEATEILSKNEKILQVICFGEAAAETDMAAFFGFGIVEKDIIFALCPYENSAQLLKEISKQMQFNERHKGLGFSVPIQSASNILLKKLKIKPMPLAKGGKMKTKIDFELIVTIVKRGYADYVISAGKTAGATGGTIIFGRGSNGNAGVDRFLGISVQQEKEIVLILVTKSDKKKVMLEISKSTDVNNEGMGLCFSLPVTNVVGISHLLGIKF